MPFGSGWVAVQELTGGTGFGGAQGKCVPVMVGGIKCSLGQRQVETLDGNVHVLVRWLVFSQ